MLSGVSPSPTIPSPRLTSTGKEPKPSIPPELDDLFKVVMKKYCISREQVCAAYSRVQSSAKVNGSAIRSLLPENCPIELIDYVNGQIPRLLGGGCGSSSLREPRALSDHQVAVDRISHFFSHKPPCHVVRQDVAEAIARHLSVVSHSSFDGYYGFLCELLSPDVQMVGALSDEWFAIAKSHAYFRHMELPEDFQLPSKRYPKRLGEFIVRRIQNTVQKLEAQYQLYRSELEKGPFIEPVTMMGPVIFNGGEDNIVRGPSLDESYVRKHHPDVAAEIDHRNQISREEFPARAEMLQHCMRDFQSRIDAFKKMAAQVQSHTVSV